MASGASAIIVHVFDEAILPAAGVDDGYPAGMTVHASEVAAEIRRRLPGIGVKKLHKLLYVLSRYGRLTGRDLEHMTHAEDPWRRADRQRDPGGSELIKNEWILAYFRADLEDEDSLRFDQDVREGFLAGAETRRSERASVDSVDGIRARAG